MPTVISLARLGLAALVIAAMAALVPLAYADPPDPTWLGGYWDDDDFDDVVVAATSATALEPDPPCDGVGPVLVVVGIVVEATPVQAIVHSTSQHQPRSPPGH